MRCSKTLAILGIMSSNLVSAAMPPIDCSKQSLQNAVKMSREKTLAFTGVCSGPIVINTDGFSLTGVGTAVIDGGSGGTAVTVSGASGIALSNLEIRGGTNGILGINGAHLAVKNVSVRGSRAFGISLQTGSSAVLTKVATFQNGVHGLDLQTGSAATIIGTFTSSGNRVFGINVNGSSLTFSEAIANLTGNALGMQVATGANAFINDARSVLNVTDNFATGLTVVSGAHMVSFGGTINASGNPVNGVSVNSKGGLDLDAGSVLTCARNGDGLVLQENSVMTVFNIPQFSGVQGFSTVDCQDNNGSGVKVQKGSTLTLSVQARLIAQQNKVNGLLVDDGSAATLVNSDLTTNAGKDIMLSFGSRADLRTSTIGTLTCDATVLLRGTSGFTCPTN